MIAAVDVVIPVRNEEQRLESTLEAVLASRRALQRHAPVCSRVVVVLDDCTDASREIALQFAAEDRIDVIEVDVQNVGRARAAGFARVLEEVENPGEHWICSTDGDSLVPQSWLLDQYEAAKTGALVALGAVEPQGDGAPRSVLESWRHAHVRGARHVYGANLGVRADAYLAAGGFPPLRDGEDVALVRAIETMAAQSAAAQSTAAQSSTAPSNTASSRPTPTPGTDAVAPVIADLGDSVVITSSRLTGRTPGGFAGYLRNLVEEATSA